MTIKSTTDAVFCVYRNGSSVADFTTLEAAERFVASLSISLKVPMTFHLDNNVHKLVDTRVVVYPFGTRTLYVCSCGAVKTIKRFNSGNYLSSEWGENSEWDETFRLDGVVPRA